MGIQVHIDSLNVLNGKLYCAGWAVSEEGRKTKMSLLAGKGKTVPDAVISPVSRPDISRKFFQNAEKADCGFEAVSDWSFGMRLHLFVTDGTDSVSVALFPYGILNTAKKTRGKIRDRQANAPYKKQLKEEAPNRKEKAEQKKEEGPVISLVVPLYHTPMPYLKQMIGSVRRQTYGNFELCLSDAAESDEKRRKFLLRETTKDSRVKVVFPENAPGISENTNAALALATGDLIGFLDHDDVLTEDALFEVAKEAEKYPDAGCFYTDEDKMSADGKIFFEPHRKPDFDRMLLLTNNYISHFFLIRADLMRKESLSFRKETDGAQDYDLILLATRHLRKDEVRHIPKVLYHWRSYEGSTASKREAKQDAAKAGLLALTDFCKEDPLMTAEEAPETGYYRVKFQMPDQMPFVSVILQNAVSLSEISDAEQEISSWSTGKTEVILETESGLNRKPRGEWLYFADCGALSEAGENFRKMGPFLHLPEIGAVTGKCVSKNGVIDNLGIHLEKQGEKTEAVWSFAGFPNERISYGNLSECLHNVYGAEPAHLLIRRDLYEKAGSPVKSRLNEEESMEAAVLLGDAVYDEGLEFVCEPDAVFITKERKIRRTAIKDGKKRTDKTFPDALRQGEDGEISPVFTRI